MKGQFFILSVVAIVIIFFGIGTFLSVKKTRFYEERDIGFIYRNIKNELEQTISSSLAQDPTGSSLEDDLNDLSGIMKNEGRRSGYTINIEYEISGTEVDLTIDLTSKRMKIHDEFKV